jgi:hypothetical protein
LNANSTRWLEQSFALNSICELACDLHFIIRKIVESPLDKALNDTAENDLAILDKKFLIDCLVLKDINHACCQFSRITQERGVSIFKVNSSFEKLNRKLLSLKENEMYTLTCAFLLYKYITAYVFIYVIFCSIVIKTVKEWAKMYQSEFGIWTAGDTKYMKEKIVSAVDAHINSYKLKFMKIININYFKILNPDEFPFNYSQNQFSYVGNELLNIKNNFGKFITASEEDLWKEVPLYVNEITAYIKRKKDQVFLIFLIKISTYNILNVERKFGCR